MLEESDWSASWIGFDAALELAEERPTLRGASWIQFPDEPADGAPAESRFFRGVLELPADRELREATMMITADDVLELWVNGEFVIASDSPTPLWKSPASVRLDRFLVPGRNVIAVETQNLAQGMTALPSICATSPRSAKPRPLEGLARQQQHRARRLPPSGRRCHR